MKAEVIYEDKYLRLEYVKEGNYIHETWWGITTPLTFKRLLGILLSEMERLDVDGLLLDAREHKGLSLESQKLGVSIIGKYARKKGRFKEAIMIPEDLSSQYSVENYSVHVSQESPIEQKFFENIDAAAEWLTA